MTYVPYKGMTFDDTVSTNACIVRLLCWLMTFLLFVCLWALARGGISSKRRKPSSLLLRQKRGKGGGGDADGEGGSQPCKVGEEKI